MAWSGSGSLPCCGGFWIQKYQLLAGAQGESFSYSQRWYIANLCQVKISKCTVQCIQILYTAHFKVKLKYDNVLGVFLYFAKLKTILSNVNFDSAKWILL